MLRMTATRALGRVQSQSSSLRLHHMTGAAVRPHLPSYESKSRQSNVPREEQALFSPSPARHFSTSRVAKAVGDSSTVSCP